VGVETLDNDLEIAVWVVEIAKGREIGKKDVGIEAALRTCLLVRYRKIGCETDSAGDGPQRR
jgi:hypothetical protein